MIEFMTLYNNRNGGILSSDGVFSKDDINKLSDVEYLKGISESTGGHAFSILEVQGLIHINKHAQSEQMKRFIQIVSVTYGHKVDTDEFLKYLKLILTRRAAPGMVELLDGGDRGKMLKLLIGLASLYGWYLMVLFMSRSLEHRTQSSKTVNAIMELMTTSNCPVPELSPALSYLVDNNWISETEQRILIAAKMTDVALNGGCNPLQSKIEHIIFEDDYDDDVESIEPRFQEMKSALVPVSFELTVGQSDDLTNAVSTKVKSIKGKYSLSGFEAYSLMANSFTEAEFDSKLKQYELAPESAQVVNVKKATSALDVLSYAYGGIKGQLSEYISDVRQFQLLNPIPMADAWNEMKYTAKHKIMHYKHMVDKGMLTMETANDELWAWFTHASILFVMTKSGIFAGASLLLWMIKEINNWRKGKTNSLAIESDYSGMVRSKSTKSKSTRSKSPPILRLKSSGGRNKKTMKQRKRV
jgi:hypothetical protein